MLDNVSRKPAPVSDQYRVQALPTNYLVDSTGKVIWRGVGFKESDLRAALKKAGFGA